MQNAIAWFKKLEGEQKPKFRVGDTIKCKYDDRQFTIKSVDLDKGIYTYTQDGCGNDIDYADENFKLVEQKPAEKQWSEEDEAVLDALIRRLEGEDVYVSPHLAVECLKSLRPQSKQEWSEDDEKVLHAIRNALNYEKPRNYLKSRDFEFTDILAWLKSLKDRVQPQSQWKPSEQDILLLERIFDDKLDPRDFQASLQGIIEQLKKLKG